MHTYKANSFTDILKSYHTIHMTLQLKIFSSLYEVLIGLQVWLQVTEIQIKKTEVSFYLT